MKSGPNILQCVIRNVGILWADVGPDDTPPQPEPRWFSGTELLLSQGFRHYLVPGRSPTHSFLKDRADCGLPVRRRATVNGQAGNTMNVVVMQALLLYIGAYFVAEPLEASREAPAESGWDNLLAMASSIAYGSSRA